MTWARSNRSSSAGASRHPGLRVNYVRRHWRGESSLAVSFWVNFLLLFCALHYLERFTLPPYLHGESVVTAAVAAFFLLVRFIVYPWQVVGVIRACERRIAGRHRAWVVAAEGVVVLSLAATLAMAFSSYQALLEYKRGLRIAERAAAVDAARGYSLELAAHGTLIHLRGAFEVGITAEVARLLAAQPQVRGIILDSDGGQIYEGRGLARLIAERALSTYSLANCASSCATAFVAGATRALGGGAKLGFHQYKSYSVLPAFDLDEEHAKDIALFAAQGIAPDFLHKIFAQPPEGMWWPPEEELLKAGVVHRIDFSLDGR